MREVGVSLIRPNPDQPRRAFPEDELDELAQSIREHGILQPLLLRETTDGYVLVSGERRLRAAILTGLSTVPAIMIDPEDARGSLTIALVENVQRADLGVIELARAYKRLQEEFGRTQEEIAGTVGKSRPHIANTLRLLDLGRPIQEALEDGSITAGHARALLMAPPEARNILFERMIREGISVRVAEKTARAALKAKGNGADQSKKRVSADTDVAISRMLVEIEKAVETALGRKCIVSRGKDGKGRLILEYYSDRDLEALVEKLRGN